MKLLRSLTPSSTVACGLLGVTVECLALGALLVVHVFAEIVAASRLTVIVIVLARIVLVAVVL